jgi:CcmD family protein
MRHSFKMLVLAATSVLAAAGPLAAQAEELGRQTLGRPYWHVFLAYAIAWVFVFGWIVSITRRLGRIERSLQNQGE